MMNKNANIDHLINLLGGVPKPKKQETSTLDDLMRSFDDMPEGQKKSNLETIMNLAKKQKEKDDAKKD